MIEDDNFIVDIVKGLLPRFFKADHKTDRIIYEEDQEVSEMYFM